MEVPDRNLHELREQGFTIVMCDRISLWRSMGLAAPRLLWWSPAGSGYQPAGGGGLSGRAVAVYVAGVLGAGMSWVITNMRRDDTSRQRQLA